MKKSIPLDVSSTLSTITTDTPIAATPYANATGVTTEKAPVLIAVRSSATVTAEEFAMRMVKSGGQGTEAQARLALNAVAAVLGDLVEEYGAITVNTPFGTIQTFIAGTLENAQDTPDPKTNRAFLGVVVPESYRRQFARMTAYVSAGACPVKLKRVFDKATYAKGIRGTLPFYLEGLSMTIGGEGETLELLDPVTRDVICAVSVDEEVRGMTQFLCTLSPQTAIEAGTYLLRLTTLAGGETTLWPVELKVELLEAVDPRRRVVLSNGSVGGSGVFFEAENAEGIRDYVNDGITEEFSVDLWKNGEIIEEDAHAVHVLESGAPYVEYADFAEAGDTVKIVAHVNPAKTDFVQEDAVLEFTVEE